MDSRDPWEKNQAVVMSNAAVKRAVLSSVICIMWCKCWRVRNAVHIDKITEWRVGIYLIREQENIWLAWNKITNSSYYCFFCLCQNNLIIKTSPYIIDNFLTQLQ